MILNTNTAHAPMGWKVRQARAKERLDRNKSGEVVLIRAVRQGAVAIEEAEHDATRDYEALNAPVQSPLPAMLHPQVAARVTAFLADIGITDFTAPLEGETLTEMVVRYADQARISHRDAVERLREFEVEKAQVLADEAVARVAAIKRAGTEEHVAVDAIVAPVEPKRPRSRARVVEGEDDPILPV